MMREGLAEAPTLLLLGRREGSEVIVDIGGGNTLTSVITRRSADGMGLRAGDDVTVVIKPTEIMVAK